MNKGFTLIETLIYIGLFAIVIGGGMVGAYGVIEGTGRTSSKTILEQDANFILRKMDWALTGIDTIDFTVTPFKIYKKDFSPNPIVFAIVGNDIAIKKGVTPPTILNSSRIKILNLLSTRVTSGSKDGVQTTFTATTVDGKLSQTFSITKYIRHE